MEESLWESANKLRGTVEPSEYKHVVLGLIFLKFASDKFEERRKEIVEEGEEEYYTLLGTAYGINFAHCVNMGTKNKERFWDRVFGYRIIPNRDDSQALLMEKATGDDYLTIKFYELG